MRGKRDPVNNHFRAWRVRDGKELQRRDCDYGRGRGYETSNLRER